MYESTDNVSRFTNDVEQYLNDILVSRFELPFKELDGVPYSVILLTLLHAVQHLNH